MNARQKANIHHHVLAATTLLDLAAGQGLTLASMTQACFDAWTAEGRFTYEQCTAAFVRWAVAGRFARPDLKSPHRWRGSSQPEPCDTERRWQDASRLLHDDGLALHDRVAGLLVLLYAQSATDIEDLTTADVGDDGTTVSLTLGKVPIELPEPLAGLVRELVATRHGQAAIGQPEVVPWLFPGGRPGQHLGAIRLGERLTAIGLHPRTDRAAALVTLAGELPAGILARMLGISIHTAVAWQKISSGDWMTYAAEVSRRTPANPHADLPRTDHLDPSADSASRA